MKKKPTYLAIAGSLRAQSHNHELLRTLKRVGAHSVDVTMYDELPEVPLFNEDNKPLERRPKSVMRLHELIDQHDGVVIATPEYSQSVPGVLKNVLDWISIGNSLDEKPVAILGGTTGVWGTRYAQASLRHTLVSMGSMTMQRPMVFVNDIKNQLSDAQGDLNQDLEKRLQAFATSMAKWAELHNSPE